MLIHDFLKNSAKKYTDKEAVVCQKKRLNYKELDESSGNFAGTLLDKGVEKGDRVVLFLENSCDYLIAYFGILKVGAIIVALNSQLVARELNVLLDDCSPEVIVTDNKHKKVVEGALALTNQDITVLEIDAVGHIENHEPSAMSYELSASDDLLIENVNQCSSKKASQCSSSNTHEPSAISHQLNASDLALIIYTSGTTGKPKGVMLSHRNICANADSIVEYLQISSDEKAMVVLPFYYSYGNSLLTTHIKAGGTLVLDNRFLYPNVILDTMLKEKATSFAGVPSHFAILLKKSAIRKYKFPELRYVTQAGGSMPFPLIQEFLGILPDVKFYVMYGQTEATARLSYLDYKFLDKKKGSIGKAIPGVKLEVLTECGKKTNPGETGEIVAKGENIMLGYWKSPEETEIVLKKEGLFTGDLAKFDEDGFLYLVSRKKYMIKSGANRISPFEIEEVVCQLPEVKECAAIGIPDEILGEAIALFIVADSVIKEQELMLFCKQNLAVYKLPKRIEFISELPKTASGKIKREELKKLMNTDSQK
ncbi:MAG: class I adenylate-forming enzyme family protein [Nanoarchaeota archaeon]